MSVSTGSGGKKYWSGFLGGVNTFISNAETYYGITVKNKLPFYFDGSSFGGLTSGGKARKEKGYEKAKEYFAHLEGEKNKKQVCLISHSEGGAFACGIAEYLKEIGYTIKENLLLHCDEADEFEIDSSIPTYQLNAMYFTKDGSVLKKIASHYREYYNSQKIKKIGNYYVMVDWMVGDYRLKGAKKYGVMVVPENKTSWQSIHTYLVDNKVFEWIGDLKNVTTYDAISVSQGKTYAGKGQQKSTQDFYRINDDFIVTNYPK